MLRRANVIRARGLQRRILFSALFAAAAIAGVATQLHAQNVGDLEARLDAHLAAGEFGPARALAGAADGALRDRFLGQIAGAQADAGARRASLATLAGIGGDVQRGQALSNLAGSPIGPRGGAAAADFDSLIDLITATVRPDSWEDVGGVGAVEPFPGGVYVDPKGVLTKIKIDGTPRLTSVRRAAMTSGGNRDVFASSELRKVSLTRLEKEIQLLWADGRTPDEAMLNLAGMTEIKYLLVYPETSDIVIAGPAGDWKTDAEGRIVNAESGRPVLQLDDLVVLLRSAFDGDGTFTCSIVPRKENLAATQAFLNESSKTPLKPGRAAREKWLGDLRDTLGRQDIEYKGIDPRTRVARTIVEADYHMKLVGMGLEEGTLGVESYLDTVAANGGEAPPMNVLRWWFTLNYDAIKAGEGRNVFEFAGQGVKVLSENEMLTERGERVHTGKSDELTNRFARSFTKEFDKLMARYPVYAELQNIFDLALVAEMIRAEDLAGQTNWHLTHFGDVEKFQVELAEAPVEVETVINHKVINGKKFIAGVSGGVAFRPQSLVKRDAIEMDTTGDLAYGHKDAKPAKLPQRAWWWD